MVKKVLGSAVAVVTWQGGKVVPDTLPPLPPSLPPCCPGWLLVKLLRTAASQQGQLGTRESPEVLGGIDLELVLIDLLLCSSM